MAEFYKTVEVGDTVYIESADSDDYRPNGYYKIFAIYDRQDQDFGFDAQIIETGVIRVFGNSELAAKRVEVFAVLAPEELELEPEPEYTGGSVSYYTVHVASPTTPGVEPYNAECNDIIEALGMNYAEGNAFKAIWRRAAAAQGKVKKGYTDGLYDAQKVVFFGERMIVQEELNASKD